MNLILSPILLYTLFNYTFKCHQLCIAPNGVWRLMSSKRCTPKVIFGLIDNRRKARFIFRGNSSRITGRPPRGTPSSLAQLATLDSGRLSFPSATAATLLLGGLNVATRRRVILVCPSLAATLAPRRRLQSDLSITRGGFARASAAKVRPLSTKKKSRFRPTSGDTGQFHPRRRVAPFGRGN